MSSHIRLLRAVAFAAEKHRAHRRKDVEGCPYINHLLSVASVLAEEGGVTDEDLLLAAVLHDAVEDTATSFAELEASFGPNVAGIVREVTDDKGLRKEVRKRLQEERAPGASSRAKQLMIADKISNLRDIVHCPPDGWSPERKLEYLAWSRRVVAGCRKINERLDKAFDAAVDEALRHFEGNADRPPA